MPIVIVEVATPEPPQPPVMRPPLDPRRAFGAALIGANGTVWDLNAGPVFLAGGASGFGPTDPEHWFRSSTRNGSTRRGGRVPAKELVIPLKVIGRPGQEWRDVDADLWDSIPDDEEVTLVVTTADAQTRSMPMWYTGGGDPELDVDSNLVRRQLYPATFTGRSHWLGEMVVKEFEAVIAEDAFPTADSDPFVLSLAASNDLVNAQVTNPGDTDRFGKWTIDGPMEGYTVGVGSAVVVSQVRLAAGERRIIDMDPDHRTVRTGTGADAWLDHTVLNFEPIPKGRRVPLNLDMVAPGAGAKIRLEFRPEHRKAWNRSIQLP